MSRCEKHQGDYYGILCPLCVYEFSIESPSPAPPPTADTSPSRIQNAASANDAASLFAIDVKKRGDWYVITCTEMPGLLLAGKDFEVLLDDLPLAWRMLRKLNSESQRIEVSGVEGHASANEVPSTQKPTINRAGIYAEMEPRSNPQDDAESVISAAGINPGLTSSLTREQALQLLDRYAAASIDRWCTGELKPQVDAAAEACLEAFGIGTEKASSLDAPESLVGRESRNTCGKIAQKPVGTAKHRGSEPPLRIAVDPWQGLGKTWSEK